MGNREKRLDKIAKKYGDTITGVQDLTAGEEPSMLFYILAYTLRYLLDFRAEEVVSERGVRIRRRINGLIHLLGPGFLMNPQTFENRNFLRDPLSDPILSDKEIALPKEPVIWASNHAFKDDTLASILAAKRHAYILFGSLPQFYNTLDGITAWMNGVIMTNRKVSMSKRTSAEKAVKVMHWGADLMVFPEGVWNKSPNALLLDLWPGIYRIACESGAKVVPVVHYLRDCGIQSKDNPIHTVIDDPVRIDDLSERAALEYLRDVMATWYYLMMEQYGQSTRREALRGADSAVEAWEEQLTERVQTVDRYDREIELCADYMPKWKVTPKQVWQTVADIEGMKTANVEFVSYAIKVIEQYDREDFQHRF